MAEEASHPAGIALCAGDGLPVLMRAGAVQMPSDPPVMQIIHEGPVTADLYIVPAGYGWTIQPE